MWTRRHPYGGVQRGEVADQSSPTHARRVAAHTDTHESSAVAFGGEICQSTTWTVHTWVRDNARRTDDVAWVGGHQDLFTHVELQQERPATPGYLWRLVPAGWWLRVAASSKHLS
mgnify:CR=1 FL=1